ncbi:hypothetical protein T06_15222 [Trichinella sp. T6]|nr:hypothetical protein T06_15222 [Trichinella sp. T6]
MSSGMPLKYTWGVDLDDFFSAFEQVWSHSATAVTMEYVNTTDRF